MIHLLPLIMFLSVCLFLMLGYPVAFTLGGVSMVFAGIGYFLGVFDPALLGFMPNRLYGIMTNQTLMAVPLFVLMGVILEKSKLAERLLLTMEALFGARPGGLAIAVVLVGALLAASTGIVGAVVVTLSLLSLPTMLKRGYHPSIATGTLCATGTLGQIIPPSIALVLLADVISNAYQQAQLAKGLFSLKTVSVADLFLGALGPGLMLVLAYIAYLVLMSQFKPHWMPAFDPAKSPKLSPITVLQGFLPVLLLILLVLGSIFLGVATPTEAAAVGAMGAFSLALFQEKNIGIQGFLGVGRQSVQVTAMVFMILIGANLFSLVFRGLGGDEMIHQALSVLPGGVWGATLVVMVIIFLLGFILDFIEITFVVVPIVAPVLLQMGVDPIWLGVLIAINLQTSFLTPPFGFALFYLRGVAANTVKTRDIYWGVLPFILIQVLLMCLLGYFPELATGLPKLVYN